MYGKQKHFKLIKYVSIGAQAISYFFLESVLLLFTTRATIKFEVVLGITSRLDFLFIMQKKSRIILLYLSSQDTSFLPTRNIGIVSISQMT